MTTPVKTRNTERGSAMIIVVVILVALLAGGAYALFVQVRSTKSAGLLKAERSALYCAEAGLTAVRSLVAINPQDWPDIAAGTAVGWWDTARFGDIDVPPDGDDFEVTAAENGDPNDGAIFLISTCTKFPEYPATVMELITISGVTANCYKDTSGQGCGNTGNAN